MDNDTNIIARKLFRIFKIDDDFEIWVGKNDHSNDLLTFKYSSQNDLWFHVRGSSGSHVLLKCLTDELKPTKEHIRTAAEITAYYSKSRNANNVKVAYTNVKNVKKYKGADTGSVVIKGEKLIKVNPKIAE